MGKGPIVAGVLLIAAGAGALGYAFTRPRTSAITPEASAAMASAVGKLDGDLRAARASVEQRARTLAESGYLRAALGTDTATAVDMVGRELALKPDRSESLEFVQVEKAVPANKVALVALPRGSGKLTAATGRTAALTGQQLWITQTNEVTPSDEASATRYTGFVTARRTLDLAPALAQLRDSGVAGRFEVGSASAPIGESPPNAATEVRPVPSEPEMRLVVAAPPPVMTIPMGFVGAGSGCIGLGLVLIVVGALVRRKPEPAAQPDIQMMPTVESRAPSSTKLSQMAVAAGTPSPVASPGFAGARSIAGGDAESIDAAGSLSFNPSNLGPGAMIGRWEVLRRLGSGGMADVYLAHAKGEAGFEKLVAIKVMHSHLARNKRAVDLFLDEARLAARIHHPNVVGIQDLGKIGEDYVIVMDYVDGIDLERLLASAREVSRPVPIDVGLGILRRICDGLHAAHTAVGPDGIPLGLIHRDVKCANVLVSRQGIVKVVDFGIAKATVQVHQTALGETKGTPAVMAPEQRVGDVVDVRVDVYAVAAVGYELLTGQSINLDLAALAHLGVENWPHLPLPSSQRGGLPVELDELLLESMAFDRTRRPPDCAAFEAALETIMKRYGMAPSDKDIARWVESELRLLVPPYQGGVTGLGKPVVG